MSSLVSGSVPLSVRKLLLGSRSQDSFRLSAHFQLPFCICDSGEPFLNGKGILDPFQSGFTVLSLSSH